MTTAETAKALAERGFAVFPVREEWRSVVGYEGIYEVSDQGRVRSLDKTVHPAQGSPYLKRGRVLKPQGEDYGHVRLSHQGTTETFRVHRLVCEAFHGPAPEGKPLVLHWDDDPGNNTPGNLYWGDSLDNEADKIRNGNKTQSNRTHCPQGHLLQYPNLERWNLEVRGWRKCLSCGRESALARSQGRPFDRQLADARYEGMMNA